MRKQIGKYDSSYETYKPGIGLRLFRIGSIMIIILGLCLAFGIWLNSNGIHGGKTVLKKINIISREQETSIIDEFGDSHTPSEVYKATEEADILPLLNRLDTAHYFTYIPEGYELIEVNYISFKDIPYEDDSAELDYKYYKSGDEFLLISFNYVDCAELTEEEIKAFGYERYISPVTGQELLITEEMDDSNYKFQLNWKFEQGVCNIYGYDSTEDGIKIAESIYQYR